MKQICKYFGIKYVSELKHYRGLEKALKAIVDKVGQNNNFGKNV